MGEHLDRVGADARYVIGLDLGQAADYTALSIGQIAQLLQQQEDEDELARQPRLPPYRVLVRHLDRFPLRMPYPDQVTQVCDLVRRTRERGPVLLTIDHTGGGRAVVDLFRAARPACPIWPVTIATSTMGSARRDPQTGDWTVPKKDLIGALVTLAHSGRLVIADRLPHARTLRDELLNFRMKITAASNLTYEAWREGEHDDLVLATALACWAAQRWAMPGGLI